MDDIAEFLKSVATPAGMLGAIVYFLMRSGKFLSPLVEKMFTAHVGMVESLKTSVEQTAPLLHEQHHMITDIHEVVVPGKKAA